MKLPFLDIHIVTGKILEQERKKAVLQRDQFTNKQMEIILHENAELRNSISIIPNKVKKNYKDK